MYLLAKIDISAFYSVLLNVIKSVCKFTDEFIAIVFRHPPPSFYKQKKIKK